MIHVAVVRTLRSPDRIWLLEWHHNDRIRIFERDHLKTICWPYELDRTLVGLGVDADQLIED